MVSFSWGDKRILQSDSGLIESSLRCRFGDFQEIGYFFKRKPRVVVQCDDFTIVFRQPLYLIPELETFDVVSMDPVRLEEFITIVLGFRLDTDQATDFLPTAPFLATVDHDSMQPAAEDGRVLQL